MLLEVHCHPIIKYESGSKRRREKCEKNFMQEDVSQSIWQTSDLMEQIVTCKRNAKRSARSYCRERGTLNSRVPFFKIGTQAGTRSIFGKGTRKGTRS